MLEKKTSWTDLIQAFWPIILFIFGIMVWIANSQTVSKELFNALSIRVSLVEAQVPDKSLMLKIQENQAVMRTQLDIITKNMDDLLEKFSQIRNK